MTQLCTRNNEEIRELKPFLDRWVARTEVPSYIKNDPVLFMHCFEDNIDNNLAGFFGALFAWGRRDIVIRKTEDLMERMNHRPAEFIGNFRETDRARLEGFKHRTFKPVDIYWMIVILQRILNEHGTFEQFWDHCYRLAQHENREIMAIFPREFFGRAPEVAHRTRKHISDADKNSSCKRLYLYLRWAIRAGSPVDAGTMDFMPASELMIPLDVHVARQARRLGLLKRTYNDWKATRELTDKLELLDPSDPVKYDYALFGLGVSGNAIPEELLLNPAFE